MEQRKIMMQYKGLRKGTLDQILPLLNTKRKHYRGNQINKRGKNEQYTLTKGGIQREEKGER